MNRRLSTILFGCLLTVPLSLPAVAAMDHPMTGKMMSQAGAGHHGKGKAHKGHHFLPHWSKTLSDQQKHAIDEMHLKLNRELVVLKAEVGLREKELNVLVTQDAPDPQAIDAKAEAIIALKKRILKARYAHIVEMRAALTPEQRISFDMNVLDRSGIK